MAADQEAPTVVLAGFGASQAAGLERVLTVSGLAVRTAGALDELARVEPEAVILAPAHAGLAAARKAVLDLRDQALVWSPVVLLTWEPPPPDESVHWALAYEPFPPDPARLAWRLAAASPLPTGRRGELVQAAMRTLHEAAARLSLLRHGGGDASIEAVRAELQAMAGALAARADELPPAAHELLARLSALGHTAVLGWADLEALSAPLTAAETALRDAGIIPLAAGLHPLAGRLRLLSWQVGGREPGLLVEVRRRLQRLDLLAAEAVMPRVTEPVEALRIQARAEALELSTWDEPVAELARRLRPELPAPAGGSALGSVLVVEDDPHWRELLVALVRQLAPQLPVFEADSIEEAERQFDQAPEEVLALVDLGLPSRQGSPAIDLDGGAKFITAASGKSRRARFMVLTAAADHGKAVRSVLAHGVEPADYIPKDPSSWEDQLRSRLRLALAARRADRLPVVEVLRETGCWIRVNNVEFSLGLKAFTLLCYLAAHPLHWHRVDDIRVALSETGPAYDITPDLEPGQLQGPTGLSLSPSEALQPRHIEGHVHKIGQMVKAAFAAVGQAREAPDLIKFSRDIQAYRLAAQVRPTDGEQADQPPRQVRRVLVVEDEPGWHTAITGHLRRLGFEVRSAWTVADVNRQVADWVPELVSLDLQLPADQAELKAGHADEANGVAVLRWLRAEFPEARVALLTSMTWSDKVFLGVFNQGVTVHDYIAKGWTDALDRLARSMWHLAQESERGVRRPPDEAVTRVHRVTLPRRAPGPVKVNGEAVKLTGKPADVFWRLAACPNQPVGHDELIDAVWPDPDKLPDQYEDALHSHVTRLRRAIEGAQRREEWWGHEVIENCPGAYRLRGVVEYA